MNDQWHGKYPGLYVPMKIVFAEKGGSMSQRTEILNALQRGEALTRMDCLSRFGCAKAPARISELRQDGWPIETVMTSSNGKRFAVWRMEKIEYKIALEKPGGGWHKVAQSGIPLCGGVFGYGDYTLTHVPTGRSIGEHGAFATLSAANNCALELYALDLPWESKTLKSWNALRDLVESTKAKEIIEKYNGWTESDG